MKMYTSIYVNELSRTPDIIQCICKAYYNDDIDLCPHAIDYDVVIEGISYRIYDIIYSNDTSFVVIGQNKEEVSSILYPRDLSLDELQPLRIFIVTRDDIKNNLVRWTISESEYFYIKGRCLISHKMNKYTILRNNAIFVNDLFDSYGEAVTALNYIKSTLPVDFQCYNYEKKIIGRRVAFIGFLGTIVDMQSEKSCARIKLDDPSRLMSYNLDRIDGYKKIDFSPQYFDVIGHYVETNILSRYIDWIVL